MSAMSVRGISAVLACVFSCATIRAATVVIEASPSEGVAPLIVSFTATSPDAVSYLWEFGDGAVSTAVNPSHTYAVAGTYNVTLTGTDSANQQSHATMVIVVTGSSTAPVTDNMSFRWAIRDSTFKLNFKQPDSDSLSIESAFSTADLPKEMQGLAVSFKLNGVLLIAGIMDSRGIIESSDGVKPSTFLEIYPKEQTLTVSVSKANLSSALASSGALDQTIPAPGVDVLVSFTLTVGARTYPLKENFNYKSQAGKTGRGKFNFRNNIGSINQGFFVITRGTAEERNKGDTHLLQFEGLLALPMKQILQHPATGSFQFRFSGSTPTTLLFDSIVQKGNKLTYEQSDRALSVIKKLTIDTKARTFSIVTWDVLRNEVEGGTGIPVRGAPATEFYFELRFDLDQPDGTTFRGLAATLLARSSIDDEYWKSGPKN